MIRQNGHYGTFCTNMETIFQHGLLIEHRVRLYQKEDEELSLHEKSSYAIDNYNSNNMV